jgi:hypothetical protein
MTDPDPLSSPISLSDPLLEPDQLLAAEFQYIAQTAFQANEDRARVSTFYIVTLGSLVAALFSGQLDSVGNPADINRGFAVVFFALSFFGLLTLLQLVRLREAWFESALAMNQIKRFYIQYLPDVPLDDAIRWKTSTLPRLFKPWSIGFLQMLQVVILGGVTFGTAILFLGFVGGGVGGSWGWAISSGVLFALVQMFLYWFLLRQNSLENSNELTRIDAN